MHYDSALSIGRRIQSGETSSLAVTNHLLDRIVELDSDLKSFVTVCADQARAAAINADPSAMLWQTGFSMYASLPACIAHTPHTSISAGDPIDTLLAG